MKDIGRDGLDSAFGQRSRGVGLTLAVLLAVLLVAAGAYAERDVALRDGRLYVDGQWVFLKIGKSLIDYGNAAAVDKFIENLDVLEKKHYNAFEFNCYWHHFDKDGDGEIDVSLAPLSTLIDAVAARGLFPCLSVETYGVGGGTVPAPFWERHPGAVAVNAQGKPVSDSEYGFGSAVPSLFSSEYLRVSRAFIRNLTSGIPHEKLLYFETTVEPQYIGNQSLDYSVHARRAFEEWRAANKAKGGPWPNGFPIPDHFIKNPVWNRFRAQALAQWVNGDAAVFRAVAGDDKWVAVDYLETGGKEMRNRNGRSFTFLQNLTCANILQVNWHWHLGRRAPNNTAYQTVSSVMKITKRPWAVTEHMTFNGSDYTPEEAPAMLRNTLARGTRFGWEFVNVGASSNAAFSLYNDDWSPKPLIAVVDDHWDEWMAEVKQK